MGKYCIKVIDRETGKQRFQFSVLGRGNAVGCAGELRVALDDCYVRVYTPAGREVSA